MTYLVRKQNFPETLIRTRDHPFSTYAKFSEKLTFVTPRYAHVRVRIMGVRNVSFSENFAYVVNG